jgi:flavorubredoxin
VTGSSERWFLLVSHSRTGSTAELAEAAEDGARQASTLLVRHLAAEEAGPDDVLRAAAILLAAPARFGGIAGLMKDFLERIYHPCLERTPGLPAALVVKGDTDVDGAVRDVERILTGLRWRLVLPPLRVVGPLTDEVRRAAFELGGSLAAGVEMGAF